VSVGSTHLVWAALRILEEPTLCDRDSGVVGALTLDTNHCLEAVMGIVLGLAVVPILVQKHPPLLFGRGGNSGSTDSG
jgi:hypothetical protein